MAKSKAERDRFSSRDKVEAVLRVLSGGYLNLLSHDLRLTNWAWIARRSIGGDG